MHMRFLSFGPSVLSFSQSGHFLLPLLLNYFYHLLSWNMLLYFAIFDLISLFGLFLLDFLCFFIVLLQRTCAIRNRLEIVNLELGNESGS